MRDDKPRTGGNKGVAGYERRVASYEVTFDVHAQVILTLNVDSLCQYAT